MLKLWPSATYAPAFKSLLRHVEIRTPCELEAEVRLTFDQLLFNHPVPGCANYRTPVRDLWICGACTRPGGGVTGATGRNAAGAILPDAKLSAKAMSDA